MRCERLSLQKASKKYCGPFTGKPRKLCGSINEFLTSRCLYLHDNTCASLEKVREQALTKQKKILLLIGIKARCGKKAPMHILQTPTDAPIGTALCHNLTQ